MKKQLLGCIVGLASLAGLSGTAHAVVVDLELNLLVDVSGSVDATEFALQRDAYEAAFKDAAVVDAIQAGTNGAIAVSFVYWSGASEQVTAVDWTLVNDATSAAAFGDAIAAYARPFSGNTGLGSALNYAGNLFTVDNGFEGLRNVIDVSGDGSNNTGLSSSQGRDNALAAGVDTINGIVIGGSASVLSHYQTQVIGGTNAFVLEASDFDGFKQTLVDKLETEIRNGSPVPAPATWLLMILGFAFTGMAMRRRAAAA